MGDRYVGLLLGVAKKIGNREQLQTLRASVVSPDPR